MNSPDKITEQDLHTFVNGELDVASHAEFEAWLTDHPEDAQNIAAWGEQKTQLQALFGDCWTNPFRQNWKRRCQSAHLRKTVTLGGVARRRCCC